MDTSVNSPAWAPPALLPMLQREFRTHGIPNLDKPGVTPAFVGRLLWTKTRDPQNYGPLSEDARRFIRGTGGQARVECTTAPDISHIDAAYLYDMRLAYASGLSNLPYGEPVRARYPGGRPFDMGKEGDRYARGRYKISFEIPPDWAHIGIFMVPRLNGRTWQFPADPGGVYTTWAANCECVLAINNGWRVRVEERITFRPPAGVPRPLDEWRDKLIRVHDAGDADLQAAIRKIILHTIGAFHPRPRTMATTTTDYPTDSPPGTKVNRNDDGTWTAKYLAPIRPSYAVFDHPEWSKEIWARTRTKLLSYGRRVDGTVLPPTGALTVPRATVLGFMTDGLFLSAPADWPDDGRPGTFRLKKERHFDPPRVAPHAGRPAELHALFPEEEPPDAGTDEPDAIGGV
jgi:hypothetical protein